MTLAIVGSRVDALTLAYRVELDEEVISRLDRSRDVAREHGRDLTHIPLDPKRSPYADDGLALWGEMRFTRASKTWNLSNAIFRTRIDLKATGGVEVAGAKTPGWVVEIIFSAQALADMANVGQAVRLGRAIVSGLGTLYEQRVRRFDLACDIAGWEISPNDADSLVKKSAHAKQKQHGDRDFGIDEWGNMLGEELDVSPDVHEVRRITGISVCPGGDLMLRIYDKPAELRMAPARAKKKKGDKGEAFELEKARIERARWIANGWDGFAPIVRTEFQVRGEAVRDFGVRDPERWIDPVTREAPKDEHGNTRSIPLEDVVDGIWQRCLSWCRLVDRGSDARATRCKEDERWALLRTVTFMGKAKGEAARRRYRGGATVEQTMGCALSLLGARDELSLQSTAAPMLPDEELSEIVRGEVRAIFGRAGEAAAAHLIEKWGPRKAIEHVAVTSNAVLARFCDDPRQLSA